MKAFRKQMLLSAVITLAFTVPALAQGGGGQAQVLQKLEASARDNQQKLHQYTWLETRQMTLKGDSQPAQAFSCEYGPDGRVQKVPIGAPPPQQQAGGKLKQRMIEKKKAEMQQYMQQVQGVIAMYVPPDPQRMQQAFQQGNVSINSTLGSNQSSLVFKNYAQQGDQMTITFDNASRKIQALNVNTYLDQAKDAVTLAVQFASLPDGTNYSQQTVLDAKAKQLTVTTTNSNYAKRVQ